MIDKAPMSTIEGKSKHYTRRGVGDATANAELCIAVLFTVFRYGVPDKT